MALITLARVVFLTTLALFSTRETVAVETLARRATCSRFMMLVHCTCWRQVQPGCQRLQLALYLHAFQDPGDHRLGGQFEEAVGVVLDQPRDFRNAREILQTVFKTRLLKRHPLNQ